MRFTYQERPKYFYAAGLLLYLRAFRTALEEKVLQNLSERWSSWFDEDLTYDYLVKKCPLAYSAAELNWCEIRMEQLNKEIKGDNVRQRLGLPLLGNKGSKRRNQDIERERSDLLPDQSTAFYS